jgi:hypothetical protein
MSAPTKLRAGRQLAFIGGTGRQECRPSAWGAYPRLFGRETEQAWRSFLQRREAAEQRQQAQPTACAVGCSLPHLRC